MLEVKQVDNSNRQSVVDLIADHWGSSIVVTRGKVHHAKDLDGFAVYENSEMVGLITYHIVNNECEICPWTACRKTGDRYDAHREGD